jgi:hypothetical protein
MRSLAIMRGTGAPVVFDATPVQLPGGQGTSSGGAREHIPVLRVRRWLRVAGLFMKPSDPSRRCRTGPTPGRSAAWKIYCRRSGARLRLSNNNHSGIASMSRIVELSGAKSLIRAAIHG